MLTAGRSIVERFSLAIEGAMGLHRDRKRWRKAPTSGRGEGNFRPIKYRCSRQSWHPV